MRDGFIDQYMEDEQGVMATTEPVSNAMLDFNFKEDLGGRDITDLALSPDRPQVEPEPVDVEARVNALFDPLPEERSPMYPDNKKPTNSADRYVKEVTDNLAKIDKSKPSGLEINQGKRINQPTTKTTSLAENVYEAINQAEMTGYKPKDQWIRTKSAPPEGSTAFGPVQITRNLYRGYRDNHKDLFTKEELVFLDKLIKQGDDFNHSGKNKGKVSDYKAVDDYGGEGTLIKTDEDKKLYKDIALKMIQQHLDDSGGDWENAIRKWRYGADKKDDPRYWDETSGVMGGAFRPSPYTRYNH